jgi:TonB family protein
MSNASSCGYRSERPFFPEALCFTVLTSLLLLTFSATTALRAQNTEQNPRKLIYKVEPDYPDTLKRAEIGGVVRLDIMISARGTVDQVSVAGGNPILADVSSLAVKQWKYAPADASTKQRVTLHFEPHK